MPAVGPSASRWVPELQRRAIDRLQTSGCRWPWQL